MAMTILTIVTTACAMSLLDGLKASASVRNEVVAADLVTGALENLRVLGTEPTTYANIPITTESLPAQTVGSTTYTLTQTTEYVVASSTTSICGSGSSSTSSLLLRATVSATWTGAPAPVTSTTTISPPTAVLVSTDGSAAVTVNDSKGNTASGDTVTLTGPQTSSVVTSADGCAYFPALLPGSYTATVSGGTNGVSPTQTTPASQSLTVTAGSTTTAAISYDQGGTLSYTFTDAYDATNPAPAAGMPLSLNPCSGCQPFTTTTTGGSITPVYPANYTAYAGSCTDANPLGLNKSLQSFYSSGTATPAVVASNTITAVALPLFPLDLSIVNSSHVAQTTAAGTASAVAGATSQSGGGACAYGSPTYTLNTVSAGVSKTAVGLGHLNLRVNVTIGGVAKTGTLEVWVKPDGVYNTDANGNATTEIYPFSAPTSIPVTVS